MVDEHPWEERYKIKDLRTMVVDHVDNVSIRLEDAHVVIASAEVGESHRSESLDRYLDFLHRMDKRKNDPERGED